MSTLEDFVNEQSYLLFFLLEITKEELLLWKENGIEACENGQAPQSFTYFSKCVSQLSVVNDRAERHIKLIQDFIGGQTSGYSSGIALQNCPKNIYLLSTT